MHSLIESEFLVIIGKNVFTLSFFDYNRKNAIFVGKIRLWMKNGRL